MLALALPFAPETMLNHPASDAALQPQPLSVARSNDRRPPSALIESALLLRRKVHGAAAWLS